MLLLDGYYPVTQHSCEFSYLRASYTLYAKTLQDSTQCGICRAGHKGEIRRSLVLSLSVLHIYRFIIFATAVGRIVSDARSVWRDITHVVVGVVFWMVSKATEFYTV
jgi:hypothetical protein